MMIKATTTIGQRSTTCCSFLGNHNHMKGRWRYNSFKAFAQRNVEAAAEANAETDVKPGDNIKTSSQQNIIGSFSNISKRNEASRSSRNMFRPRNGVDDRQQNRRGSNAVFTSNKDLKSSPSENRPWDKQQRQNTFRNNGPNRRKLDTSSFLQSGTSKAYTPLSKKTVEDIKDISALRNTFMPNRPKQSTAQSWRTGNDDSNTNSLIGKKFTPSWYSPKMPPTDGNTAVTSKIDSAHSLEQVLKNNATARKADMAQRYRNAGEAVPMDLEEKRGFSWRTRNNDNDRRGGVYGQQRNNQQHHHKRFGNNNNDRYQPRRSQDRGGPRQIQRPWHQKKRRHALTSLVLKEVKLPSTSLTLVDLSLLLRVKKGAIVRTLRSMGEQISYQSANQDEYKIEPEMMEYICVDLGIEPLKNEQKVNSVEEAERRALRQSSQEIGDDERSEDDEKYAALPRRSPVVSIMGHVDHGKTTLMDALRRRAVTMICSTSGSKQKSKKQKKNKSRGGKGVTFDSDNVAGTEAGGITQVITAFEVPLPLDDTSVGDDGGNKPISTVTFLDTPGHAAFKKMRQSGSSATDVIVLVVAADDGVSPQTIEIIEMFKSIARSQPQSISLVVAVTKIDKHGIDIDEAVMRIENQLIEQEIFTENVLAGGGDEGEFGACQLFPVSGITGEGLDDLIEGLALQSELMDLRADDDARGEGIVIDARMEKGLGVVADCVIRWGKIEPGDFLVSGTNGGKVRFLNDVANKPLKKGRPSQPVRIVGFKTIPKAGDPIVIAASEEEAKELVRLRESEIFNEDRADFENDVELQVMGTAAKQGSMLQRAHDKYGFDSDEDDDDEIVIPVVIKADSHGALEAVRDALVSIGTDSKLNVVIDPVEMSTGVVTTSDVVMARESNAAIFSFGKVGIADKETKSLAENDGVSIRSHDIIYRLLDDAKVYFERYLPTEDMIIVHGKATVQAVFNVTDANKKSVSIAGLRVNDGTLFKLKSKAGDNGDSPLPCFYRVIRNGEVIVSEEDKLKAISLRKVKDDADSVRRGDECGLGLDGFNDIKEDDVVECYSVGQSRGKL